MSDMLDPVVEAIEWVLDLLFQEDRLIETVTYKLHGEKTWNPVTKRNETGFTDSSVSAINVSKGYDIRTFGQVPFEIENVSLLLKAEDCPEGMSVRDKIIVNNELRGIVRISNYFNKAYGITLEGPT